MVNKSRTDLWAGRERWAILLDVDGPMAVHVRQLLLARCLDRIHPDVVRAILHDHMGHTQRGQVSLLVPYKS